MEVTKKKAFWLAFGLSLLTYGIFEWWPMSINEYLAGFINVFCHFLLTWICLTKIKVNGKTNYILLCCALLLGRWLPQIPLHLFFFLDTIYDVYIHSFPTRRSSDLYGLTCTCWYLLQQPSC
mgnify:CR=1 FL=1